MKISSEINDINEQQFGCFIKTISLYNDWSFESCVFNIAKFIFNGVSLTQNWGKN